jgi:hypothetical protein
MIRRYAPVACQDDWYGPEWFEAVYLWRHSDGGHVVLMDAGGEWVRERVSSVIQIDAAHVSEPVRRQMVALTDDME